MGIDMRRTLVVGLLLFMGCAGDDGGSSGSSPISSGLTANFAADNSPSCPGAPDSLTMRKQSVGGRIVTVGIQATDCDGSMGIFGVSFEVDFDPNVAQCSSTNPCEAGTLLSAPLATPQPVCVCDNAAGHLIGSFTRAAPGTNQSFTGSADIARFSLEVTRVGTGRVDFLSTGSSSGTALITLSGSPTEISGLAYSGGSVLGH